MKISILLTLITYHSDQRIAPLKQALEDVSVLAHLDGYRPEHLVFVDQVLKELGEFSTCLVIHYLM